MGRTLVSPDGREVAALVEALPAGRFVLGLAGAPGSGKTTLAAALAAAYGCPVVPMDGFHRPNAELAALGRLEHKGAPDTFAADGPTPRCCDGSTSAGPCGRRRSTTGCPTRCPDAIEVPAEAGLVVTEGNYLLLDAPRVARRAPSSSTWSGTWSTDEQARLARLVRRHVDAGRTAEAAREWVARVDQANADLVEAAAPRADLVLDVSAWGGAIRRT